MNKSKIILAALVAFQTSNNLIYGNDTQITSNNAITQDSEITTLLNSLKEIQSQLITKWVQFLNVDKLYPDMSVKELGNEIIHILNTSGQKLPDNIRNNLIAIVEIKKQSISTTQFRSGHVLINDTMILLIDTMLGRLHHETSKILELGVSVQDFATVKRALTAMRKTFDNLKRNGDYCSIENTIDKLNALV